MKACSTVAFVIGDKDCTPVTAVFEHAPFRGAKQDSWYLERRLRRAVRRFLATHDAREVIDANNGDFNWGDALDHVPDEGWRAEGLRLVSSGSSALVLDHDENLAAAEPAARRRTGGGQ